MKKNAKKTRSQYKIYHMKAALNDKLYRIIEIRGDLSLGTLAETILDAYDFDRDHLYGFYSNFKHPYKSKTRYELTVDIPKLHDDSNAKSVYLNSIQDVFKPRKKMIFLYDYGMIGDFS